MKHYYGATRHVFLIWKYALKFPQVYSWKHFLGGLLANMQEVTFYKQLKHERMCPIVFSVIGGFLVIMKRTKEISAIEYSNLDFNQFRYVDNNWIIPVEDKKDSFGILDGKIVAIDYGS
jgi:hypothetical protein